MIAVREKPIHWAEAFGLSALVHVGMAYFVLTTVVDLNRIFEGPPAPPAALEITSLTLESSAISSPDIGAGADVLSVPESVAPIADVLDPVAPVPQTVETVAATPITPETQTEDVSPVEADIALVVPEALSPLRPHTQTLAPIGTATQTAARPQTPATTELQDVSPARESTADPATPPPAEAAPPTSPAEPDQLAAELINRIRGAVAQSCVIAIPQQTPTGVRVQIFAAEERTVPPFTDEIFAGLSPRPDTDTILIDPRQCAALDYVRQAVGYPTSPMALGLDVARIPSGTELTGRLSGTGGRNISLLLIDDNGVVQDLGPYLTVAVNTARFAAPLRRTGNVRDTRQLLLAVGTGTRPAAVGRENGQLAEDFFTTLDTEIEGNAALTLIPFEVR